MSNISINKINKFFGNVHVIKDVSLNIKSESFTVLVGPSGCGKSTNEVFLGRDYGRQQDYSDEVASSIDEEVKSLLSDAHIIAGKILGKFKKQMEDMVKVLMEKETIDREEVARIFNKIKKVNITGSGKNLKLA